MVSDAKTYCIGIIVYRLLRSAVGRGITTSHRLTHRRWCLQLMTTIMNCYSRNDKFTLRDRLTAGEGRAPREADVGTPFDKPTLDFATQPMFHSIRKRCLTSSVLLEQIGSRLRAETSRAEEGDAISFFTNPPSLPHRFSDTLQLRPNHTLDLSIFI